jgi:hypothetical protein
MANGTTANGTEFKVHLDGYNFLPYLRARRRLARATLDLLLRSTQKSERDPVERLEVNYAINSEGNIASTRARKRHAPP